MQVSHGKVWVGLPGKAVLDRDKRVVLDETSGKLKYAPVMQWDNAEVRTRFSDAAIQAIRAYDPHALDEDAS